jgi:ABC-2 type transport system ATP-binding protein
LTTAGGEASTTARSEGSTVAGGDAAIRVMSLTRRFRSLTAVDGLSFSVARGELFGLVGPDGAGKTTTLRMLAGVLRPSAGEAVLGGVDVARDPDGVKLRIAYMSQRFGLYADLTVSENLEFYADLYRVPKGERGARLSRLFRFSGLDPFRDRLAGKLSGGMKQKLGLSCALIHEPEILLLDEPTFGVDPVSRRDLWLIVHEMVSRGVTVVASTAYMDEAERFDRVAMIHAGRLLALDTPDALRREFEGEILAIRLGDRVREAREVLRAIPVARRVAIFGDRLHVTVGTAATEATQIEGALRAAGLQVTGVEPVEPSMEDVFIDRLTGEPATDSGARR